MNANRSQFWTGCIWVVLTFVVFGSICAYSAAGAILGQIGQ